MRPLVFLLGVLLAAAAAAQTVKIGELNSYKVFPAFLEPYRKGSWGPEGASNLLHGYGGWRRPWLPDGPLETVGAG